MCQHDSATSQRNGLRPELAAVLRLFADRYEATQRTALAQRRVRRAIEQCRTAALGGQLAICSDCGHRVAVYHSCRNRHCPKCQTAAKERWLAAREAELLPIPYFHVVFTLPHEIGNLARGQPRLIYELLFDAARRTLLTFGQDPRHLGGQIGAIAILHTWGQTLIQHLHLHCIVTGGALAHDGARWIPARRGYLFSVRALSIVFRAKFLAALEQQFARGACRFSGSLEPLQHPVRFARLLRRARRQSWVVFAKRPFAGPLQVLRYLGRYTHRIALTNDRLLALDHQSVTFAWKDYADGGQRKQMTLAGVEFVRRFMLHVLPQGFVRIRHFGFLANTKKSRALARCRQLLAVDPPGEGTPQSLSAAALIAARCGHDVMRCPVCHVGQLQLTASIAPIPSTHPSTRAPPQAIAR